MNSDLTHAFIWIQRIFTPRTFCLLSSYFSQWFIILHVFDSTFMEQMSSHCSTRSRSFGSLHDVWSAQLSVFKCLKWFFTSTFQVKGKINHVNNYLLRFALILNFYTTKQNIFRVHDMTAREIQMLLHSSQTSSDEFVEMQSSFHWAVAPPAGSHATFCTCKIEHWSLN